MIRTVGSCKVKDLPCCEKKRSVLEVGVPGWERPRRCCWLPPPPHPPPAVGQGNQHRRRPMSVRSRFAAIHRHLKSSNVSRVCHWRKESDQDTDPLVRGADPHQNITDPQHSFAGTALLYGGALRVFSLLLPCDSNSGLILRQGDALTSELRQTQKWPTPHPAMSYAWFNLHKIYEVKTVPKRCEDEGALLITI